MIGQIDHEGSKKKKVESDGKTSGGVTKARTTRDLKMTDYNWLFPSLCIDYMELNKMLVRKD